MEWFGGKPAGCTRLVSGSYQVIFSHGTKSFSSSEYGSLEKAKDAAEEWRYIESTIQGLTKNRICINEEHEAPYLKVQLQTDLVMKCDVEHIDLIEDSIWTAWKGNGDIWYVKRRSSKKTGQSYAMYHTLAYPDYEKPRHLNGDGLDNRSYNMYDASTPISTTQSNNNSGITGVYKSGNGWCAQIGTKDKRVKKTFMISKYGDQEAYYLAVQQRQAWEQEFNHGNKDLSRKYKNFVSKLAAFDVTVITTLEEYLSSVEIEKYPELVLQCSAEHQFSLRITSLYNKLAFIKKNPERCICAECEKSEISKEEISVRKACEKLGFAFLTYKVDTRRVMYKCKCGSKNNSYATNLTCSGRQAQCPKCQNKKFKIKTSTVRKKLKEYDCRLIGKYINTHTPIKYKCICGSIVSARYCMFIMGKRCRHCGYGVLCEHNVYLSKCVECSGSICEHNEYYGKCKKCDKEALCEHGELRSKCITCKPQFACENCLCQYVNKTSKFHPYCFRCHCILNPNAYVPMRYKFREHYLRDYLELTFKSISLVFDKTLGACSLRRPDVFIECYTHCIIIECDENQHKSYECENKRMMELFQDAGMRPIVFIRFNPDSYTKNGLTISGCFKRNSAGILKPTKEEWEVRTKILKDTIEQHIGNIPDKECTILRLFYNK